MGSVGEYILQSHLRITLENLSPGNNGGNDETVLYFLNFIQLPFQECSIDVRMIRAEGGHALCVAGDRENSG